MALDSDQVNAIAEVVRIAPSLPDAAASWRLRYPGVRAMRIGADEMREETPAFEFGSRRVYFAASDGLCVFVTRDANEADMLILTESETSDGDR